jgi:hypothetical protein
MHIRFAIFGGSCQALLALWTDVIFLFDLIIE